MTDIFFYGVVDGVGVLLGYGVIVGVGVGVLVGVIVGVTVFVGVGVGLGKQFTPVLVNTNVPLSWYGLTIEFTLTV